MVVTLPHYHVNVPTGLKAARIIEDANEYAHIIKRARRPLLVLGPRTLTTSFNGRLAIEYMVDLAKTVNIPVCATAHTKKKLLEIGLTPESSYDIIEIINHLKDSEWKGVRKEGNHDLVIFLGIRCDLAERGLSTLKHFAPHLRTLTLCKTYHPNASYSLPNLKDDKWKEFLKRLIAKLKGG
jgi:acetyl-CoA decarbonylase/synthase complex subunit epsilon